VAAEVARALDAPLEPLIARKLGHPDNPEYAVCAVTETGPLICDEVERVRLDPRWLQQAEMAERVEAKRRREAYVQNRQLVSSAGKAALVIDDGIATGLTMQAAVAELRERHTEKLVVAVPCAPREAIDTLYELADEVLVLTDPDEYLGAVGAYYDDFPQLTDDEVVDLLGTQS
jgi:predicted phosphoribosyltransferase